jgi:hypothetical protein
MSYLNRAGSKFRCEKYACQNPPAHDLFCSVPGVSTFDRSNRLSAESGKGLRELTEIRIVGVQAHHAGFDLWEIPCLVAWGVGLQIL